MTDNPRGWLWTLYTDLCAIIADIFWTIAAFALGIFLYGWLSK